MISGFTIEYEVGNVPSGADTLQRMAVAFERAGAEVTDFGHYVFPKLVPLLEEAVREQFDAQGKGPNRGAWAGLSPAYEAVKRVKWPGKPILEASGALKSALTDAGSTHAQRVVTTDEFDYGTFGLEYASLHQTGTSHMPDRPLFDFDEEFEEHLQGAALAGVREAMRAARADDYLTEAA